jgi:hypothetical protein
MGLNCLLLSEWWSSGPFASNAGSSDLMPVSFNSPNLLANGLTGSWYLLGHVASQISPTGAGNAQATSPCFSTIIVQKSGDDPTAIANPTQIVPFASSNGATNPYTLYFVVAPPGYVAIGCLCFTSTSPNPPPAKLGSPDLNYYACIRQDLVSLVNPQLLIPSYCSLSSNSLLTPPMPYGLWTLPVSGCFVPSFGQMGTTTQGSGLTTYQWSPPAFPVYDLPPLPGWQSTG